MTSVLPAAPTTTGVDLRHRRPLLLAAGLAGGLAAVGPLVVCLALGVAGWYLADAGAHGAPRDGLRVGALAWLAAHGTGVRVAGVGLGMVPLGLTLGCAWTVWRLGHRLGDSVSGHGPDADRIADGERDWTVLAATSVFGLAYAAVLGATVAVAGSAATAPSMARGLFGAALLVVCIAGPAVALGSGRLPIWVATLPAAVPATWAVARRVLRWHLLASAVLLLGALALDWPAAANVMSQLGTDPAGTVSFTAASAVLLPNAVVFSGSYLLGPGFTVGVGTLVSPTLVLLGPLPLFPLLAALPDPGTAAGWTGYLVGLPALTAAVGTVLAHRRHPTSHWDQGALRGCVGGVAAGVAFTLLAVLAGGSVGPGRMQDVGPLAGSVLAHAVAAFGVGGLVGGLLATWWSRRGRGSAPAG